jgi:putative ABC transport system ATP-binding protein
MPAIVSIKNVVKGYVRGKQRVNVLHGVDLDVDAGEFLALMGPSGSGKTTLLNLIGGLDRADTGEVTVAGERLDQLSGNKLAKWRAHNVGFIFQFYNLLPVLSAERNVEVPLLLTKLSAKERKRNVGAALELVGLADRAQHKPAELSGGQQQRVAIARAIVSDPRLLVCDEPTGDLDRETSESILGLLQMLNSGHGKTIIMVTHDPRAADHASRRLQVDKGRLEHLEKTAA